MKRWLICLNLLVVVAATVYLFNAYWPYRPRVAEAVSVTLDREGRTYIMPDGSTMYYGNVAVIDTVEVSNAVLVIHTHDQIQGGVATLRCSTIGYINRRLLYGVTSAAGPGICYPLPVHPALGPIELLQNQENGAYVLLGVVTDPHIASVHGMWSDGYTTSVPIKKDTFFFFRERDDVRIEWVVGVDAEGQELPETRTDNR